MTIIYIVTSGEYSDYQINAVFDSEEKARAYIDYAKAHDLPIGSWSRDELEIEEWTLNQVSDPISRGLTHYGILFPDIQQGDATERQYAGLEADGVESSGENKSTAHTWYQTSVWAKDQVSAMKIANERRVRYLLEHEGAEGEAQ